MYEVFLKKVLVYSAGMQHMHTEVYTYTIVLLEYWQSMSEYKTNTGAIAAQIAKP